jgi:hypothetical protein
MVHHPIFKRAVLLLIVGTNPLCAGSACAGLGGDVASVLADADEMQGIVQSMPLQRYEIREISTDSGMRVREFQDRDGIVFAVSWSGPAMPDLQRLLGTHFEAYSKAVAGLKRAGLQRSLRISSPALVVELSGHLRAYTGLAYLPASIPAGTSTQELR